MLAQGTAIELTLPGAEAPIRAKVLSCSSTMISVRLQEMDSKVVHRVSLKKLPFRIVSEPSDQQQQAAPHQDQGAGGTMAAPALEGSAEEDAVGEGSVAEAFPPGTAAAVEAFTAAVESDPAAFLQPTAELAALAKAAAKALYDYQAMLECMAEASSSSKASMLPELFVEGFDAEQIWLQLDMAVVPALKRARKLLKAAGQQPQLITPETEEAIDELLEEQEAGSGDSLGELDGHSDDDWSAEEEDELPTAFVEIDLAHVDYDALLAAGAAEHRKRQQLRRGAAGGSGSDSKDGEEQQLAGMKRKRANGTKSAAAASVEDDHFKLDEMEAFVQQAEREEAGLGDGADEAQLEALLEEAAPSGHAKASKKSRKKRKASFGDELSEDEDGLNIGATAMYEDFFGARSGTRKGPTLDSFGGSQPEELGDEEEEEEEEEEEDEDQNDLDEDGFEDNLLSDDMLSGEEEDGPGQGRHGRANDAPQQFSEEEDEDEDGWDGAADADEQRDVLNSSEDDDEDDAELAPSAHARRQQRMQEKIRKLEAAAMGEKDWFMQGEVDAGHRPKNSALEVDLDFATTVKPPPQPTEEMTKTLDELIKARIAEGRFDDVVRIKAPPPETKRTMIDLDDKKPQQGLGELYEQDYVQAATGFMDDKDEEVRQAARAQFSALSAKLDALSHLHFTPRPLIDEVTVKVDVPAIMMEEAAPQFMSGASMRAPEEIYASEARGAPRDEAELSREDRKQRRAQRKRAGKKRRASKEEERSAVVIGQGGSTAGRKSEAAEQAARKLGKKATKKRGGSKKSEFSRSAVVFAKIEQHKEGTAAPAATALALPQAAAHLKL